jgi:hypothetical protein
VPQESTVNANRASYEIEPELPIIDQECAQLRALVDMATAADRTRQITSAARWFIAALVPIGFAAAILTADSDLRPADPLENSTLDLAIIIVSILGVIAVSIFAGAGLVLSNRVAPARTVFLTGLAISALFAWYLIGESFIFLLLASVAFLLLWRASDEAWPRRGALAASALTFSLAAWSVAEAIF